MTSRNFAVVAGHARPLLCIFVTFGLAQTDPYTQAASQFQQGQLDQAEQTLRRAISSEPKRPDLLGLLAVVLDNRKEYDQAERFYQRAVDIAPGSAGLWNNFGNHFVARGNEKQAEAAFLRVLEIDPKHANANLQVAHIAVAHTRGADALRCLEKLPPSDQSAAAVQMLKARALHLTGQKDAARAILDRLENDDPGNPRLAFSTGVIFAEWEQYERAEAAFSRALEKDPANLEILRNVGLAALHARHFDRAEHVFEIVIQQRPRDVESIASLARVHAAQGDNETALALLANARRLAPDRPDLLLALARMYADAGFLSGAADAYEAYLKLQPSDAGARRERGFAYCRFGRMQTGLPDLNWYVKQNPRDAIGHFELGLCQTLGDAGQAYEHLTEAVRLKPDFTPARQAHGWMLARDGKWQEALPDLKDVVEREPNNPMALLQLGRIYLELDRPAEAVGFLRRARELAPEHTGVLKQLHRALRAVGENREAAEVLEKLKTAGPDRRPLKAEAQIFDYMGLDPAQQKERFRRNLIRAAAASPNDAELKVQLGALLLSDGKTGEALAAFREALTLSPGAQILNEGATTLVEHKQYSLAREFLTRLVAADPSIDNRLDLATAIFHSAGPEASLAEIDKIPLRDRTGDVYLLKAQIEDALGQFEEAVRSLNTAFQHAPTRGDLYFWASLFLIKHNRNQQALELLNQAAKIVTDDPELLLARAAVFELVRMTGDAEDLLRKIQLRWPEWGRTYLMLGIIQATHRNPEAALQSIKTAIALGERTASAYYYLADVTRAAAPDNRDAAQRAIGEALRLDPRDATSQSLAGKISLDAGEPAKAVEYLNEAIRLKPDLTEAHYSLSIAYKKLGREKDALAELDLLRHLREQNPQPEDSAAAIREMLFRSEEVR